MFERFSSGYYLGRLYVEPREGERAAIARDAYERVTAQLYDDDGAILAGDAERPLVMKLGTTHFTVTGEAAVPADTLAIPEAVEEAVDLRNPPTLSEVFLAKADRARQLLSVAEGLPAVDGEGLGDVADRSSGDGPGQRDGAADAAGDRDPFDGPGGPAGI